MLENWRSSPSAVSSCPGMFASPGFARGHVLGPDKALDQFELAVVADGGDAPGDSDILAPVDRAGLDHGFDLVEPGLRCPRLPRSNLRSSRRRPCWRVRRCGSASIRSRPSPCPSARPVADAPARKAAVALQSMSSRALAHFQRVSSSLAAAWRLSMASLFNRSGSSNQIPRSSLFGEQVADRSLPPRRLVSLEADETRDGGRGRYPVLGQQALDLPSAGAGSPVGLPPPRPRSGAPDPW